MCDLCGHVPTGRFLVTGGKRHKSDRLGTCPADGSLVVYRSPARLGLRRIASATLVRLGDIDEVELIREGFPGIAPEEFVAMFCAPRQPSSEKFSRVRRE